RAPSRDRGAARRFVLVGNRQDQVEVGAGRQAGRVPPGRRGIVGDRRERAAHSLRTNAYRVRVLRAKCSGKSDQQREQQQREKSCHGRKQGRQDTKGERGRTHKFSPGGFSSVMVV